MIIDNNYMTSQFGRSRNKQKGFTLVELMLVVLIIGILSGVMLGVINIAGLQKKSRDARRIGDIKKIQTALELYFSDYRGYPSQTSFLSPPSTLTSGYITKIPTDPTGATGSASCYGKTTYGYYYISTTCSGSPCVSGRYVLGAILEIPLTSSDPNLCSSLNNCSGGTPPISCSCSTNYCYAVENPL